MFTFLRGLFSKRKDLLPPTDKPIQNVSLTMTPVSEGVQFPDDLDPTLKAIHTKILENPQSTLNVSEINILLEQDLKLKPITSNFYNFNKEMVNITVMEFSSINIIYDKDEHRVRSIDFTFVDAVNSTGSKLILPADAISELLVPISFTKATIPC